MAYKKPVDRVAQYANRTLYIVTDFGNGEGRKFRVMTKQERPFVQNFADRYEREHGVKLKENSSGTGLLKFTIQTDHSVGSGLVEFRSYDVVGAEPGGADISLDAADLAMIDKIAISLGISRLDAVRWSLRDTSERLPRLPDYRTARSA